MAPSPLALIASAALVAVVATGTGAIVLQQGSRFSHPRKVGGPFTMADLKGRPVTEADLRGKPAVLFFGFTHCPDVCPTTLQQISAVLAALGPKGQAMRVAFITVDPERDDPASLKTYLSSFDPRITGLTGTPEQVTATEKAYRAYARKVPAKDGDYTMEHTALVYIMDAQNHFLGALDLTRPADEVAAQLARKI